MCACMPFGAQFWALMRLCACVMRLQVKTGRVRGSPRRARGAAVATHRRAGVMGPMPRERAYKLAQKVEETVLVLTEVWVRSEMPRSVLAEEVEAGVLRAD